MDSELINRPLTMQLATVAGDKPWICTVYFVVLGGRFYWLSFPERRHSRELATYPHGAVAIAIKQNAPVTGIQAEGTVEVVTDVAEAEPVLAAYVQKYGKGTRFIELLKQDKNHHQLYRLTPAKTMLFDETRAGEPYREITLG